MKSASSTNVAALVEVLRLLAMTPDEQANALPSFVDVPDELALLFGDQRDALSDSEVKGELGDVASAVIREIEDIFGTMAGQEEYFSMDALRDRREWNRIRELSKRALAAAGFKPTAPDLSWVTYVRGS